MSPLAPNPGESYYDIIARLDPVMLELLSTEEPVLIVSHQATLRMVRGFLMRTPREDCPAQEIPLHTVMKITWDGWSEPTEEAVPLGPSKEQVSRGVEELKKAAADMGEDLSEALHAMRSPSQPSPLLSAERFATAPVPVG